MLRDLFGAFMNDPRLLPPHESGLALAAKTESDEALARVVADYIAGMTDRFAIDEWERLFDPRRLK